MGRSAQCRSSITSSSRAVAATSPSAVLTATGSSGRPSARRGADVGAPTTSSGSRPASWRAPAERDTGSGAAPRTRWEKHSASGPYGSTTCSSQRPASTSGAVGRHLVAQLGRQAGLADPRLAHQRDHAPARGGPVPGPAQHGELGAPADERPGGERIEERRQGGVRRPGPAGGHGLEPGQRGAVERQGGGQPAHRRAPRRGVDPTLEIAQRAHADAGAVGQLLLRQAPGAPVPLDEPAQLERPLAQGTLPQVGPQDRRRRRPQPGADRGGAPERTDAADAAVLGEGAVVDDLDQAAAALDGDVELEGPRRLEAAHRRSLGHAHRPRSVRACTVSQKAAMASRPSCADEPTGSSSTASSVKSASHPSRSSAEKVDW